MYIGPIRHEPIHHRRYTLRTYSTRVQPDVRVLTTIRMEHAKENGLSVHFPGQGPNLSRLNPITTS